MNVILRCILQAHKRAENSENRTKLLNFVETQENMRLRNKTDYLLQQQMMATHSYSSDGEDRNRLQS